LNTLAGIWVDTRRGIWTGDRAGAYQTIDYVEKGFQIDVTKKWNTRIPQRTLLTFDTFFNNNDQGTWALNGVPLNAALNALGLTTTAQLNAWKNPDPFNPGVSGYYPNPAFDPKTWTVARVFNERFYYGSLLNHTIELMDGRLFWTGSARQDWGKFTVGTADGNKTKFTYSTGLNYRVLARQLVAYGNIATGFVKGFGLQRGAIGSTICHDHHNIAVVGANYDDMALAATRLGEIEGGFVVVEGGRVLAEIPLPVAGLMSLQSFEEVRTALIALRAAAASLGVVLEEPFLQLAFLCLPVIPHLKITDHGMVDVDRFEVIP
jgi:hypothetical protein